MKNMTSLLAQPIRTMRLVTKVGISIAVALGAVLIHVSSASAHHGWPGFQTDRLVYISGTVSSDGVWGNPHSQFDVTFDGNMSADTPDLAIPEQLSGPEDSVRVNAALAYGGPHKELEVIIAPPAWSGRWGLDRALFCRRSRGATWWEARRRNRHGVRCTGYPSSAAKSSEQAEVGYPPIYAANSSGVRFGKAFLRWSRNAEARTLSRRRDG